MNGSTYSTSEAADDASEYAAACAILRNDPEDLDAKATIEALAKKYGPDFFED